MKRPLTKPEANEVYRSIKTIDADIQKSLAKVIEAYGWSSKVGKMAEGFLCGATRFSKVYFALEDYTDSVLPHPAPPINVNVPKRLPHEMPINAHEDVARCLFQSRDGLQALSVECGNTIGKTKRLTKALSQLEPKIDSIRCELDRLFVEEYGENNSGVYKFSPYYGGELT